MTDRRKRSDIEEKYKWKLEDIYADEVLWENEYEEAKKLIAIIEEKKGTFNNSAEDFLKTLELSDELEIKAEQLYVYAKMRRDEDNANNKYQILYDRAENLSVQVNSATSFIVPEIISIPEEKLKGYLEENNKLTVYKHFIDKLLKQKNHILSSQEEKILAMAADIAYASSNIFSMLNNADIKFGKVKDENGQEIELTKGRYGRFMENENRRVRHEAFTALYKSYGELKNTIATTLSSSVKKDVFYARTRKYNSALEAALAQDNVSVEVYEKLIDTVHNNLDKMHKYMSIRKKLLNLDELHMYDIYVALIKDVKMDIPYEEAKKLILNGLKPLGTEYLTKLEEGLKSGWIDVYENEGKTSGAYSWGSYKTHPYVLLNYDDKLDDAYTLAHEMGHSMHTYYSNLTQPYVYSQYSIFLAEVASTVNESLLIDYMISNAKDAKEKMYLINHYLEQFRGTVYRQTMFAEFEKLIHEEVEKGGALTPENLSTMYLELNKKYYGPEVVLDQEIAMEWARIPHFYSAFYVYKYATGFSAATSLKEQILKEGEQAVTRYIDFLKAGSSDYPVNVLQKAGVDLTKPEPVQDALDYFGRLVDQLEELV